MSEKCEKYTTVTMSRSFKQIFADVLQHFYAVMGALGGGFKCGYIVLWSTFYRDCDWLDRGSQGLAIRRKPIFRDFGSYD